MKFQSIYNTVKNVDFMNVIYAENKWVLLGRGKNNASFDGTYHVCTSSDLIEFTDKVFFTTTVIQFPNIAFGNGNYVITIASDVFVSNDLENWKKITLDFIASTGVRFLNGQFIITTWSQISYSDGSHAWKGRILTSKNGTNWQLQSILDYALQEITFYQGYYYVSGVDGYIGKSSNLQNWTKCTTNVTNHINTIISGVNGILAGTDNKVVLYSNDGTNWERVFDENDLYINSIDYGNGIYMLSMTNPAGVAYSKDCKNFNWLFRTTSGRINNMCFSSERQKFLICGNKWAATQNGSIITIDTSRDIVSTITDEDIIYIYDLDFNFVGTIDSFKSLRWRRKYFEAGEFEIVVSPQDTIDILKENYLVIRNNYTEAGIIETIQINDDGTDEDLTISGRFLSSILDRRIIKSTINFSGSSIDGMKALLNKMTPFPHFEIEPTNFDSENINFQCTYKNVYDYLIRLSKYSNVGFRIVPNLENKVFIFENYKGLDRTSMQDENERYSFSDEEFNIDSSSLTTSNTLKVNYALVGGKGEGANRILVEADNEKATGFDLYETFVDSKNQNSDNISDADYKKNLLQDGYNALIDETNEFKFDVNSEDYKDKFDLGDIVDVAKTRWNYKTSERITEVEEIIEDGKKTITIVTGNPLPESWINDD